MGIQKIAKIAGVSKATVSRAMNKPDMVSPDTVEKINNAMKQTGYQPKSRKTKKNQNNIGILIVGRDMFMEYSPARWRMLHGMQDALKQTGANLFVEQVPSNKPLPEHINKFDVDGLIVLGTSSNPDILAKLEAIPSVWVNSQGSNDKDNALARNQLVGQMAAQHLVARGHRNLAFFKVFTKHTALEMDGDFFEFTAMRSGCSVTIFQGQESFPENDSIASWQQLHNTVEDTMKELCRHRPEITGLFVPVGQVVVMCYEKLQKLGVKPGKDVEIVACGCENAMLAALSPMPANISINTEIIGRRAVEQLLWRIANPKEAATVNITVMPTINEHDSKKPL
jgi:LacI family transcriptional regulator